MVEGKAIYHEPTEGSWEIHSPDSDRITFLSNRPISAMPQDEARGFVSKEGFRPATTLECFNLFGDMYGLRDSDSGELIEQARQYIQGVMREGGFGTLTDLTYTPKGKKDKIVHGFGKTERPIVQEVNLVGQDGRLSDVLSQEASLAWTGKSPEEAAELLSYINQTPAYLWRLNSEPSRNVERVARFSADSGRAYLDGDWDRHDRSSRLGVKFEREASRETTEEIK